MTSIMSEMAGYCVSM